MLSKYESNIPTRLDRYLKRLYPHFTQGLIEQALRKRLIKVNDKKTTASYRLIEDDLVFIDNKIHQIPQKDIKLFSPSNAIIKLADQILNQYLIYQDNNILAINKPAGLAVQGGSKINLSIDNALKHLNQNGYNLKLVHRLDKETSGVLLIAQNYLAATQLAKAFEGKLIQKTYLAIIEGHPVKLSGKISGFLSKNRNGVYDFIEENESQGKLAITYYQVLQSYKDYCLIEFNPLTGRTHQLRFHAKKIGCPIVGDKKYASNLSVIKSAKMLLHAKSVVLPKEIFNQEIKIEADLPDYFSGFC